MYARIVVVQSGATVSVTHVVIGMDQRTVAGRATELLKALIARVTRDDPEVAPSPGQLKAALRHGHWWTTFDSEEFTAMIVEPEAIEWSGTAIVQIAVDGGAVTDVQAPAAVTVVVRDYDTDGVEQDGLDRDGEGRRCVTSIWSARQNEDRMPSPEPDRIQKHLTGGGFVVLTHNAGNDPNSHFEAWAYQGPLDFDRATPIRFGLGADPIAALLALGHQLSQLSDGHSG